jgi:DNA-binding CsgD family transcriptional regulator
VLIGRDRECASIDALLDRARAGTGGMLVLRGEAGVGKSALLAYAVGRAPDMRVLRGVGVHGEAELEFSGLLEVCRPVLDLLDELPEPQAVALRGAFRLAPPEGSDRFAVAAATLGLLALAAEPTPVLTIVDDVDWLDRSSINALLFAGRRLHEDRVAFLFGLRDPGSLAELTGVEALEVRGLAPDAALELLARNSPPMAQTVASSLCTGAAGNPLALLEFPTLLTEGQLAGRDPLPHPLPAGREIERAFGSRLTLLPAQGRDALLVAAVSVSPKLDRIVAALAELGFDPSSLEPAEDVGLVRIDGDEIAFRHPLVRSVVFHAASASTRRAVHRALAAALGARGAVEERAWHLAAAAVGADAEAATALADAGRLARQRSGYPGAAAAFERAARLTPDTGLKVGHLCDAAEAFWMIGRADRALALLDEAADEVEQTPQRVRLLHLRGQIERLGGDVSRSTEVLFQAATLAQEEDPGAAVAILADAVEACLFGDMPERALEAGRQAAQLAPEDGSLTDFLAESAYGAALFMNGDARRAERHLARALRLAAADTGFRTEPRLLTVAAIAASWLDRLSEGLDFAATAQALARERGALALLAHSLEVSAWLRMRSGRWQESIAHASEGAELARETGETTVVAWCLGHLAFIDAARGNEARCRAGAAEAIALATRRGIVRQWPERALALLDLGLGRPQDAAERLETLTSASIERGFYDRGAMLVEAYVRAGKPDAAQAAYERFFAPDPGFVDAEALAARCRGLLADEHEFEAHLAQAIDLHGSISDPFGAARSELLLGERLRRAGRRIDARLALRGALARFETLGAVPWANQARVELKATGQRLRRPQPQRGEELTAQELQVALQVAEGKTNREAGAALFLSPKTVDFHLRSVFRKLGVRSRGELIRYFASRAR